MKTVPIKTDKEKFYRQFLAVLKSVPPMNKLRPKELDVLSEIMRQNEKYYDLEENVRYTMIFSTNVRREMREVIQIGEDSFNNNLSTLRKLGILSKDNKLNRFLDSVVFKDKYTLEFVFKDVNNG